MEQGSVLHVEIRIRKEQNRAMRMSWKGGFVKEYNNTKSRKTGIVVINLNNKLIIMEGTKELLM